MILLLIVFQKLNRDSKNSLRLKWRVGGFLMFRNHFKIAWRNLMKYKFISFINIFGLTVGLTCCLLILSYIINEKSYDLFNTNAKNIYRVTRTFYAADGTASLHTGSVAPPFGPLLKNAFSDIEQMTRL